MALLFAINSVEDINIDYSGNILFGTVNRLSDGSIIKVPFRFLQVSPTINTTYVDIVSTFALQVNFSEDFSSLILLNKDFSNRKF